MLTSEGLRETINELIRTGKCIDNDDALHYFIRRERMMPTASAWEISKKIYKKEFCPKTIKEISDEQFSTMVFELNISDTDMAQIFNVSNGTIARRRQKLGIAINNHKDAYRTYQWVLSDKTPPNLDEFLKEIEA